VEKAAPVIAVDLNTLTAMVSAAVAAAFAQHAPAPAVEKAAPQTQPEDLAKALGAVDKLTAELGQVREELEKVKAQPLHDPAAPAVRQLPKGVVPEDKAIGHTAEAVPAFDDELASLEKSIANERDPYAREQLQQRAALLEMRKVFSGARPG